MSIVESCHQVEALGRTYLGQWFRSRVDSTRPFFILALILFANTLACVAVRQTAPDTYVSELPYEEIKGDETHMVIVDARTEWVSTGVELRTNDRVAFNARGQWGEAPSMYRGPDGGQAGWWAVPLLPTAAWSSLIGRIGGGSPFLIGSKRLLQITDAGRLYLAANDDPGYFHDNHGEMSVTISILRSSTAKVALSRRTDSDCDFGELSIGSGADNTSLAVLDFGVGEGLPKDTGRAMADICRDSLQRGARSIMLVDRERIADVLGEQDFIKAVSCDNTKCIVEYGKLLGATSMLHGRVSRLGQLWVVTVAVTDVSTGQQRSRSANVDRVEESADVIPGMVCEIVKDAFAAHD